MGKGDTRRPSDVTPQQYADNWERAFKAGRRSGKTLRSLLAHTPEDLHDEVLRIMDASLRGNDSAHVRLEHSDVILHCHGDEACAGEYCTLHNRSNHHMRAFPQHWRSDRGMMERTCPHGVGHPDPDELPHVDRVHGCDGCCDPAREETAGRGDA